MASMSMSPPPGSPPGLSLPKRGRGSRGGRVSTRGAGSRGGRAGAAGGAAGARKKRESTIASESAANTPAAAAASIQSPAAAAAAQREGSIASNSRRSVTTTKQGGAAQTTVAGDGDEMDEDDDDGDDELALLLGDDEYDEQAKERSEAKEALRLLLDQFSPEQFERYEMYRSAGLQKAAVRRLVNHVLQQTCSPNIVIGVRGLAKIFVGEIVESARQVQAEAGREGPVHPDDLREAYRRYQGVANKKGSQRSKLFVR